MNRVRFSVASILLFGLFLGGCSLDYEDARLAESLDEELAETVITHARVTVVRGEAPSFLVEAEQVSNFPRRNEQHLRGISFREYNQSGELVTEGSADRARIFTRSDDVEIEGEIRLRSVIHEARLEAEYLYHHNADRRLSSRDVDTVLIERDSGSWISGRGFEVDLRRNELSFSSAVEGEILDDD